MAILASVSAITPGSLAVAEEDPVKHSTDVRLLFREDWKTTPAELPITQDHVATEDLVLAMHGPGQQGIKKSHHDKPIDDPFYLWSGQCEKRWAFSLRPKYRIDLSAPDARLRLRTKQSGDRQLYVLIKLADEQWCISKQSIPASQDWREFELKFADLDWSGFDPVKINRGEDESPVSLKAIEEIGLTDLQAGGGSKASSRIDWIAVWGNQAVASKSAVVISERSEVDSATTAGCRLEKFTLHSAVMGRDVRVVVVLPPEYDGHPDKRYPVLYALHGRGAPYTSWASMAPLLHRLKDKPMIVTCFDGGYGSCYLDAPNGGMVDKSVVVRQPRGKPDHMTEEQYQEMVREWEAAPAKLKSLYTTFFLKEFVPALDHFYRVDSENRAVTGFSLGGFGALHYAFEEPRMFRSISGLSSAFFDEESILASMQRRRSSLRAVLGDYETDKENYYAANQFARLDKFTKSGGTLPPIYQHCGLKDGLLGANHKMRDALKSAGCDVTYLESEGSHNWTFWKGASKGVIDFHWEHFQTTD
ncbi:MAG: hypothetical protein GY903_20285 [Fuerstiella sp.]|nr:hypothetical protein [Fuerstiella sp.]MCP4856828.1 hypothetical protein [Fuerstiella sp.]